MTKLPKDLDPQCRALCTAMNRIPGIVTVESCCGHSASPYRIWFTADTITALESLNNEIYLAWNISIQHGTLSLLFTLEGPTGTRAYRESECMGREIIKEQAKTKV